MKVRKSYKTIALSRASSALTLDNTFSQNRNCIYPGGNLAVHSTGGITSIRRIEHLSPIISHDADQRIAVRASPFRVERTQQFDPRPLVVSTPSQSRVILWVEADRHLPVNHRHNSFASVVTIEKFFRQLTHAESLGDPLFIRPA